MKTAFLYQQMNHQEKTNTTELSSKVEGKKADKTRFENLPYMS
jgi:hypothetical protein